MEIDIRVDWLPRQKLLASKRYFARFLGSPLP